MWAGGNGGENFDSCAADGYASSMYTISIGSAAANGTQSNYDEQCSGKMAVTFVDDPYEEMRHVVSEARFQCSYTVVPCDDSEYRLDCAW